VSRSPATISFQIQPADPTAPTQRFLPDAGAMSRGSSRGISLGGSWLKLLSACAFLGNSEFAVRTVRDHCLARLKMELDAIEPCRDNIRFE
jgi:hypothetical protein